MSEYDPFGGGSYSRDSEKPKSSFSLDEKTIGIIKKVITFIIILGIIGIIVYFLFFNTVNVSFNVVNTESNKTLSSAKIEIKAVKSTKKIIIAPNETIKLNKSKTYNYTITATDYLQKKGEIIPKDLFPDYEFKVILEKDIRLNIKNFNCPSPVFIGQKVKCELQLENISTNEDYNVDNIVFRNKDNNSLTWPDFNNNTYVFVNSFGEELSATEKRINRLTNDTIFVSFSIPTTITKPTSLKIMARTQYTDNNKTTDLNISLAPNITFTSQLSSAFSLESGAEITKTYTIDNSKNNAPLSDLELKIDANYLPTDTNFSVDFDVNNIFRLDNYNLSADAKQKPVGIISIVLPSNLRAGKIVGVLSLNSNVFEKPKDVPFTINITEPENKFTISLSKASETLNYDVNTKITNTKTITLNLDNKNKIPVHINQIFVENSTGTTDCNNWIEVPTSFNNYDIQANDAPGPVIILTGHDLNTITVVTGLKICNIVINYVHPYTIEEIIIKKPIQISVN